MTESESCTILLSKGMPGGCLANEPVQSSTLLAQMSSVSLGVSVGRTTSKISDDQLFYAMQRGLDTESAVSLIVNGFAKDVLQQLPMEFAVEAQKLLGISLEGSVG